MKRGLWSEPGVPHKGWYFIKVTDAGDNPDDWDYCQMCAKERIRYEHTMGHPDVNFTVIAGCVCAGHMSDDYEGAKQRERAVRNETARRKRALKKEAEEKEQAARRSIEEKKWAEERAKDLLRRQEEAYQHQLNNWIKANWNLHLQETEMRRTKNCFYILSIDENFQWEWHKVTAFKDLKSQKFKSKKEAAIALYENLTKKPEPVNSSFFRQKPS